MLWPSDSEIIALATALERKWGDSWHRVYNAAKAALRRGAGLDDVRRVALGGSSSSSAAERLGKVAA